MDVQAAMARRIQHGLRQDQTIGGNDCDVGTQRGKGCLFFGTFQRQRVAHRDPQFLGLAVNGGGGQFFPPASAGAGRLGVDGTHILPRRDQRFQRRNGKVRGTHENDLHTKLPLTLSLSKLSLSFAGRKVKDGASTSWAQAVREGTWHRKRSKH